MTNAAEHVREKEEEGKRLLQMKPLDRDAYEAWSDAAREAVAGCCGAGSPLLGELIAARRRISVAFETDPSYYLTQLGANLRRELTVLRKCLEGVGGADTAPREGRAPTTEEPVRPPVAASAKPASKKASTPPSKSTPKTGASILVVGGEGSKAAQTVLAALREHDPKPSRLLADRESLSGLLAGGPKGFCGIVVIPSGGSATLEAAFSLGLLLGLLGPERVCVVHEEEAELPFRDLGVLHVSLQDPDGWRPKVLGRFGRGAPGADR